MKNKDKIKKLEVDKKIKDLEVFKKKLEDIDSKKLKDIEEKLLKLKESGFTLKSKDGEVSKLESATDKIVREDLKRLAEGKVRSVTPLLNLIARDEKTEEKIDKIIQDKVVTYRDDAPSEDVAKKSSEALKKEFFTIITKYDEKSLPFEYDNCLSQLSQMHGRRTLVNILSHESLLPFLLQQLLKDKANERKFIAFLKSSFFEALIMQQTSGLKNLMKQIKGIIKNVISYFVKHEQSD